ncbi:MAG: DUF4238 domain-containing protein [Xanthobacteraceae bacterium]|jgi:hypothetical protein
MGKSQHHTPVLHLRNFVGTAPEGHVWTYDKQTGTRRSSIPEETGFETHFYSVERDDGTMDTTIENLLAEIESKAAPVYRDLLKDKICHGQPKSDFANFVACIFARTPSMRRMFAETLSRDLQIRNYAYGTNDKAFESFISRSGKDRPPHLPEGRETLRKALTDPSQFVIEISREATLRSLGVMDKLTPIFFDMAWSLVHAKHGYFVTSDNALARACDPRSRSPTLGDGGFLNETVEVTLPLSPSTMLLMTWADSPLPIFEAPREAVEGWNMMRAAHAERFLYAHVDDKRVARLAAQQKETRPKIAIEGFGPKKFAETIIRRRSNRSK